MPGADRPRASDIFSAIIELAPEERAAALERACGGDAALRAEVASLLGAYEDVPDRFMRETPLAGGIGRLHDGGDDRVGTAAGPYHLDRRVGAGGMGAVYLAHRAGGDFDQRVAVKLIRRGLDTDDILARFRMERRVLAGLEHPNIARLLDGGSTDDGRPYLIMEYVDGAPIDRYCDERRLSIDDRLRLFRTVCAAVQYAHRNLVVHRDLKPANVLVTDDGTVKLLDFGIAKVLTPDDDGHDASATVTAQRRHTPAYASPEQVRGGTITTATDVYSLGVVLFELLTGQRPYAGATPAELETAIRETPPIRPATAVTSADAAVVAANRSTDAVHLRRRLAGDLEAIMLMALRKESERRYGSVDQLSDDVRRYLDGLPVVAQRDTLGYRVRKFIARRKGPVAALVTIAVLLVAGVTTSTVLYVQAEASRANEARERRMAEETNRFLESLLASIDPNTALRRDTELIRMILDDAAARLDTELAAWPSVAGRMHLTVGRSYDAIGQHAKAIDHLERAVQLGRATAGLDKRALADRLFAFGSALMNGGRYDEARAATEEALAMVRGRERTDDAAVGRALNLLGQIAQRQGRYDDATALLEEAVDLLRAADDDDELPLAYALRALAEVYADRERPEDAIERARGALEICERRLGPEHPETSNVLTTMGWSLRRAGRPGEAEEVIRRALAIDRATLSPDNPELATSINLLAGALQEQQRHEGVEALFQEALAIFRAAHGDAHTDVGTAFNNLAVLYVRFERWDESVEHLERSLDSYRRALGPDHVFIALVLHTKMIVLEQAGRILETEPLFGEWRRLAALAWPEGTPRSFEIDSFEGAVLAAKGEHAASEAKLLEAYANLKEAHPDGHRAYRRGVERLVRFYETTGRSAEAERYAALLELEPGS